MEAVAAAVSKNPTVDLNTTGLATPSFRNVFKYVTGKSCLHTQHLRSGITEVPEQLAVYVS